MLRSLPIWSIRQKQRVHPVAVPGERRRRAACVCSCGVDYGAVSPSHSSQTTSPQSEQRPSGAPYSVLLPTASIVIAYLVVALRDTRPPAAGCNREAGRCFTRFKDGARNAPLEASIAMQDAAKAAADDLMLTTRRWTPVTRRACYGQKEQYKNKNWRAPRGGAQTGMLTKSEGGRFRLQGARA